MANKIDKRCKCCGMCEFFTHYEEADGIGWCADTDEPREACDLCNRYQCRDDDELW